MDNTLIALAVVAALVGLDWLLHRFQWARDLFAGVAKRIPRWSIWLAFLFFAGSASHLVSGYAMLALTGAIAIFGFVMLAWLSETRRGFR